MRDVEVTPLEIGTEKEKLVRRCSLELKARLSHDDPKRRRKGLDDLWKYMKEKGLSIKDVAPDMDDKDFMNLFTPHEQLDYLVWITRQTIGGKDEFQSLTLTEEQKDAISRGGDKEFIRLYYKSKAGGEPFIDEKAAKAIKQETGSLVTHSIDPLNDKELFQYLEEKARKSKR